MTCAICNSNTEILFYTKFGDISRCSNCGTVSRTNLVIGQAILELYDDSEYLETVYFERLKVGAPNNIEPYLMYKKALDRLENLTAKGRLLDVGCSYGAFLELAEYRGWETFGVDVSTKAVAYARQERKLNVKVGKLEDVRFPKNHFSVITLWDVIEHLDDPVRTLEEIKRILKPDGVVVIFTINQKSLINQIAHWLYFLTFKNFASPINNLYDIHHNFFFDIKTLIRATTKSGLKSVIDVEWREAKIERWHTVPLPWILMRGCDLLDIASRFIGLKYRAILYVGK